MSTTSLSYILTTFNKLPYLKVTLPLLIAAKKSGEEIVIADGGSTDGSAEYLKELLQQGKIDQLVSEKDMGEAHGTNKAMMMARGELIKIITDDDIYHYPSIEACKNFMLQNPQYDMLGFDGFGFNINHSQYAYKQIEYVSGFKKWKQDGTPFLFCGLSFMMRRSSLAYLGLFNTKYKIVDIEYAIRVTSMKPKLAFYTGLGYVNIVNPQSNSHKFYETIAQERNMLAKTYPAFKHKITYRGTLVRLKEIVATSILKKPKGSQAHFDYKKIAAESGQKLYEYNAGKTFSFLT